MIRCTVRLVTVVSGLGLMSAGGGVYADTFGSGENSFEIEFVSIGAPGNPSEGFPFFPSSFGSVDYEYRMGKYEISTDMIAKANVEWEVDGALLGISYSPWDPNLPAAEITWYEAARFVNWLNFSVGAPPAYNFDDSGEFQLWLPTDAGYNAKNRFRNTRARYFLPSADEWHKAAFYDPVAGVYYDYATGSDSQPDGIDFSGDPNFEAVFYDGGLNQLPNHVNDVGIPSPFGTYGQGGNVREWEESSYDLTHDEAGEDRAIRGGFWYGLHEEQASITRGAIGPFVEGQTLGFRVASVPEPNVLHWILASLGYGSLRARRSRLRSFHVISQCPFRGPHVFFGGLMGQAVAISTREVGDGEWSAGLGERAVLAGSAGAALRQRAVGAGLLPTGTAG